MDQGNCPDCGKKAGNRNDPEKCKRCDNLFSRDHQARTWISAKRPAHGSTDIELVEEHRQGPPLQATMDTLAGISTGIRPLRLSVAGRSAFSSENQPVSLSTTRRDVARSGTRCRFPTCHAACKPAF